MDGVADALKLRGLDEQFEWGTGRPMFAESAEVREQRNL